MSEITLEFLGDLLKEDYPDVTLQEFQGAPGSNRGDNYTSMVYRISLKGVRKYLAADGSYPHEEPWHGSIIYKCLPDSMIRREAFKSDDLFCNEVAFYNKIWPSMSDYQAQWEGIKTPFKSIPKCYLAQNNMVILRDLNQLGFVMPDRRQGLSMDQCYFVLRHLSHFHALSLAMKCDNPDGFYDMLNLDDSISEVLFASKNVDYYRGYYREVMNYAISMVEEELQDREDKEFYLAKFREFCREETFFQNMVELVEPKEPLAVICHGDCWTNNMLFRHVGGDIAEMYIVDFQLVRYASPALDLAYVIYLCLSREQRAEHLPALLEYYTDEMHTRLLEMTDDDSVFNTTLNRDELYDLLNIEFRRCGRFGLGVALDMYPIMTCDSAEAPNVYQAEEGESSMAVPNESLTPPVLTSNHACRKKMAELVQELVDEGIL